MGDDSTSTTCGFAPVTSLGPVCGGHGVCVFDNSTQRGVCLCDAGWQGESDFQVTNSLLDCQINVTIIKVLWAVCLTVHLLVYAFVHVPKFKYLWKKHQTLAQKYRSAGKTYRLWQNKGLFSLVPYLTVGCTAQTIFAIIKLADQDLKIGQSVIITILYILWRTTFIFTPDTFQPALVASLLRSERNLDGVIKLNKRLSFGHMIFFMLLSILTIIPMVIPQDPFSPIVGTVSFAVFSNLASLSLLFLSVQAIYIENKVNAILVASYAISRDERTKKVMEKIAVNQRAVVKGGFMQFLVYGFFGWIPYLWNKHDYLVPFSWILTANQIRQVLISLVQEDAEKSSSTKPMSSPNQDSNNRKQIVAREPNDSSIIDSTNKEMHVHGLDLDPLSNFQSSAVVASSETDDAQGPLKGQPQGAVTVNVSPAMKVLRAFTPSRKSTSPKKRNFTFEEGIGDDKNTDNATQEDSL